MKKKIFIHFGPPKTGTSAIQSWLANNQSILIDNHIFYPEHALDSNNVSSGNVDSVYSYSGGDFCFDRLKAKKLLDEFIESRYRILLLSSEHFFFDLPELVGFFSEAIFIGYIRSPIEYFESTYNQSIKRHACSQPITLTHRVNGNYLKRIARAVELAGVNRFYMRAYNIDTLKENDIVSDFLSYFQVSKPFVESDKAINPSYCFEALEFMRWLNQFEVSEFIDDIDRVLQKYSKGVRHFSLIPTEDYRRYKKQSVNLVSSFCQQHSVAYGNELISKLKQQKQHVYLQQSIGLEQAAEVIAFIAEHNGQEFLNLLGEHLHAQFSGSYFNQDLLLLFPQTLSRKSFFKLCKRLYRANMPIKKKVLLLFNYVPN